MPDGTLHMTAIHAKRTGWRFVYLALLAVGFPIEWYLGSQDNTGGGMMFNVVIVAPAAFIVLLLILWNGWGQEDWRVGPDFLQLHKRLFFLRWGGRYKGRTLIVKLLPVTKTRSHWYLCIKKKRRIGSDRALLDGEAHGDYYSSKTATAAGEFMAARTGWPLEHE